MIFSSCDCGGRAHGQGVGATDAPPAGGGALGRPSRPVRPTGWLRVAAGRGLRVGLGAAAPRLDAEAGAKRAPEPRTGGPTYPGTPRSAEGHSCPVSRPARHRNVFRLRWASCASWVIWRVEGGGQRRCARPPRAFLAPAHGNRGQSALRPAWTYPGTSEMPFVALAPAGCAPAPENEARLRRGAPAERAAEKKRPTTTTRTRTSGRGNGRRRGRGRAGGETADHEYEYEGSPEPASGLRYPVFVGWKQAAGSWKAERNTGCRRARRAEPARASRQSCG